VSKLFHRHGDLLQKFSIFLPEQESMDGEGGGDGGWDIGGGGGAKKNRNVVTPAVKRCVCVCARARACSSSQGVSALAIAVHPGRSRAAGHLREARSSAHSVAAAAPQFQAWAGCSTAGHSGAGAACGTTGAAVPKHYMLAPKGASGEPQAHCPGPGSRMGVCCKGVRGLVRKHFSFQCGSRPSSPQTTQYSHGGCRRCSHVICQIF
jgi:hypothetical protein